MVATAKQIRQLGSGSPAIPASGDYVPFQGAADGVTRFATLLGLLSAGASNMYTLPQSAANNNATNIKATAGTVASLQVYNFAAYPIFLKLYDKTGTPNPATDTPVKTIPVPANSTATNGAGEVLNFGPGGLKFTSGIGFAIVKGQAVNDNTAVAANDATFNLDYV